jgi:hypothetical protein
MTQRRCSAPSRADRQIPLKFFIRELLYVYFLLLVVAKDLRDYLLCVEMEQKAAAV